MTNIRDLLNQVELTVAQLEARCAQAERAAADYKSAWQDLYTHLKPIQDAPCEPHELGQSIAKVAMDRLALEKANHLITQNQLSLLKADYEEKLKTAGNHIARLHRELNQAKSDLTRFGNREDLGRANW